MNQGKPNSSINLMIKRFFALSIRQSLILTLICFIAGVGVNSWRSDRLPLIHPSDLEISVILESGQEVSISIIEAQRRYNAREAIFIDTRAPVFYSHGHIKGALNIAWGEFYSVWEQQLTGVSQDTMLVLYCDGLKCPLSKNAAEALYQYGYHNVRVLVDGWRLWQERKLPISSHTDIKQR